MTKPPSHVYWMTSFGTTLSYREKGGGLFSTLTGMAWRIQQMREKGRVVKLYRGTVTWEEISPDEANPAGR